MLSPFFVQCIFAKFRGMCTVVTFFVVCELTFWIYIYIYIYIYREREREGGSTCVCVCVCV